MQTFLPYKCFTLSATVLDRQRLGKQRAETLQLLRALDNKADRIHNHPACIMWMGYRDALVAYGLEICSNWIERGYDDNTYDKILKERAATFTPTQENVPMPKWLGMEAFHASHRGNLLKKDYKWYSSFGWTDSPLLPYIWPKNHEETKAS
jgi:hypothetical protein